MAEVGSILDFHEKSADDADYSLRLASSGGKLMVNGTDIMSYINNVKSQAGVVAGNVANANSWWVKLGGTIPLIIQGGNRNRGTQTFPIAFSQVFGVYATRNNNGWEHSVIVSSVSNTGFYSEARNQSNDNPYDYWWYWIAFGRG